MPKRKKSETARSRSKERTSSKKENRSRSGGRSRGGGVEGQKREPRSRSSGGKKTQNNKTLSKKKKQPSNPPGSDDHSPIDGPSPIRSISPLPFTSSPPKGGNLTTASDKDKGYSISNLRQQGGEGEGEDGSSDDEGIQSPPPALKSKVVVKNKGKSLLT